MVRPFANGDASAPLGSELRHRIVHRAAGLRPGTDTTVGPVAATAPQAVRVLPAQDRVAHHAHLRLRPGPADRRVLGASASGTPIVSVGGRPAHPAVYRRRAARHPRLAGGGGLGGLRVLVPAGNVLPRLAEYRHVGVCRGLLAGAAHGQHLAQYHGRGVPY
ncbi:hypothetical protein ON010_g1205 [Phytophthora cinnamomi]|nr:hypothetical protein ON010_g1205 [Phytophthora cinnamomi]